MIYTVDLDGTLCEDIDHENVDCRKWDSYQWEVWQASVAPIFENIAKINALHEKGHTILIHTSRFHSSKKTTEYWLQKFGVLYDDIIFGKPISNFYVDPRAIKPEEL